MDGPETLARSAVCGLVSAAGPAPGDPRPATPPATPPQTPPPTQRTVRVGRDRLRLHASTADDGGVVVTLLAEHAAPTPELVRRAVAVATEEHGTLLRRVVTPAVGGDEAWPYREAGFDVADDLVLLTIDLAPRPALLRRFTSSPPVPTSGHRVGGARVTDAEILAIDRAAFGRSRALDRTGLDVARRSTPKARTTVLCLGDTPAGYAVTGRDGRRGYLQRLAVIPGAAGRGLGAWLVRDGLAWCTRHGVSRVVVNTQHDNERALGLYTRLGFARTALTLQVLERRVPLRP